MDHVEKHRRAHDAFNQREFEQSVMDMRADVTYADQPRGVTMKSRDEFVGWLRDWTAGFSDAEVAERRYIDAGEYTICEFSARGTHDGQFGPLPATGRRIDVPFCEIIRWDADGRGAEARLYYDQMSILVQLGVVDAPPAA